MKNEAGSTVKKSEPPVGHAVSESGSVSSTDHGNNNGSTDHGNNNGSTDHGNNNGSTDHGNNNGSTDHESTVGIIPLVRPADIILAVVLVAVGFAFSFFISFGGDEGQQVRVYVAGKPYGFYSLQEDREVVIKQPRSAVGQGATGRNKFEISGGKVKMTDSNCRGGDCLHEGQISKTGETIICLPHKVVIEITGGEEDFDAVSK